MPIAFELEDRGFKIRVDYREDKTAQDADVEITRGGKPFKKFAYPAYRIWNLHAHFSDAVDEFLEKRP